MGKAKWAKWSQARKEFTPAFKSSWPYTMLGLALGAAFVFVSERIPEKYPVRHLVAEHLGMGFIVSALAVFFYEWGAHMKKALELTDELVSLIREDLKPIVFALSEDGLPKLLKNLLQENSAIGQRHTKEMVSDIDGLVRATAKLQKEGIWVKEHYIGVLADSLGILRENAERLASLGNGQEIQFIAPPSEDAVDKVLVAQMKSLRHGDTYDVITNLYSWRAGHLEDLRQETKRAIEQRGVKIRRIFNLMYRVTLTQDEVRAILRSHLEEAKSGKFGDKLQVKILRHEDLVPTASNDLVAYLPEMHFGIFNHGSQSLRIQLPRSWRLSEVKMTMNEDDLEFSKKNFAEAWKIAKPLADELIEGCVQLFPEEDPLVPPPLLGNAMTSNLAQRPKP